jgi:branched-chain amino acid transport system ATP-binding protein
MALLEIKEISKSFGGLQALNNLSCNVDRGEIVGLIGPNGAGKSTLFNVVSGFYKPSIGRVLLDGQEITGLKPHEIASRGLVRTFQSNILFRNLTVEKSILLGCHLHTQINVLQGLFGYSSALRKEQNTRVKVLEILDLFGLASSKEKPVGSLPHGHQRALGVAVALAAEPSLLMLDEPFTGMGAEECLAMMSYIKRIHQERGVTILIIEHRIKAIMELCDRMVVLNFGEKIAEGSPDHIQANEAVIHAYLGVTEDVAYH